MGGDTMGGGTLSSTMRSDSYRGPSASAGGFGTMGDTFMDRPTMASRLGHSTTYGKSGKSMRHHQPYSLETTAQELARTSLPPLSAGAATGGAGVSRGATAMTGAGAGNLTLSQSMTLVQQATGFGDSRVSATGGAGMPRAHSSQSLGRTTTKSATTGPPLKSAAHRRAQARTRRRLAKLRQSPLALTRAKPGAKTFHAGMKAPLPSPLGGGSASTQPIGQSLKQLGVTGGHNHTHSHSHGAADHAVERRMCKACWSQPTKMTYERLPLVACCAPWL